MTNPSVAITFKCPPDLLERLPAPGNGRSKFIVHTLEEKFSRKPPLEWKPSGPRGRKFAAILEKGKAERYPLLSDDEMDREMSERRGRNL